MNEVLLSMAVGAAVGVLFAALKLPIPAPPVLSGVMGIVGCTLVPRHGDIWPDYSDVGQRCDEKTGMTGGHP